MPSTPDPIATPAAPSSGQCLFCGGDPNAVIAEQWTWFVERDLKSLNERIVNSAATRRAYAADRNAWTMWMRVSKNQHRISMARGRRRLLVTRIYAGRQRPFDLSNLVGGCKGVIDSMVLATLLIGDAPHQLEDHYRQEAGPVAGAHFTLQELA